MAVNEDEWRQWAIAIQPHLRALFGDEVKAIAVEIELANALALPPDAARMELSRVLTGYPETRQWIRRQRDLRRDGYRMAPASEPKPERYVTAQFPERGGVGTRVPLIVQVVRLTRSDLGTALRPFELAPRGTEVTISVSATPGLRAHGDLDQTLVVPMEADSDPVRFSFTLTRPGPNTVVVRVFLGGRFLGELSTEISIETSADAEEGAIKTAPISSLVREPGEITLEVSRSADGHTFRLVCETPYDRVLSQRLGPDVTTVVERIATQIRDMAADRSGYDSPTEVRNHLANLGAQLWMDAVPDAIRRQFWEQLPNITSFSVISDNDVTPWELLYAADHDEGKFLAERFPVLRRVPGQDRPRRLRLTSAAYVVPESSPDEAQAEVASVRGRVGTGVADRGVLDQLADVVNLIDEGRFSLLHFACHNAFRTDTGSRLSLVGGPFTPTDLSIAVQRKVFAHASPLVFFNACRSAGEQPILTRTSGWATNFMRAGSGVFVGPLWAVRSTTAKTFAESFYQALIGDRQPLGQASMTAREAVMSDGGDPTWLAYTVYGSPGATVDVAAAP